MKEIVIFEDVEDGMMFLGSRGKLINRGNKRVLIEFIRYDYETGKDILVSEWFKVFSPSWSEYPKYNNKRNKVYYHHEATNEFYSDYSQTDEFKQEIKESDPTYYNKLYGEEL